MAARHLSGTWSDGDAYERYVGRWSRLVAERFLSWLDLPPGLRWLDVGCGTGALSAAIAGGLAPSSVLAVDASEAYVADARRRLQDPRVRFERGDAGALGFDGGFDVAVSGLVLNFLPDARAAVRGMRRAVEPAGVVAVYVWDYAEGMELMRCFWDAAAAVVPEAAALDEAVRFSLCDRAALAALWGDAGLHAVGTAAIDVPTSFADFDDYWAGFLGGQGPAPAYLVSLSVEDQIAVREAVRARLPVADDGSIDLVARAWAVRGSVRR